MALVKRLFKDKRLIIIIGVLLVCTIHCVWIYRENDKIIQVNVSGAESNPQLLTYVDSYEEDDERVKITGWCAMPDEPEGFANYYVILHEQNTDEYYQVKTGYIPRPDVTEFLGNETKHDNSGFRANFSKKKLAKGIYEVYVWYLVNGNNILQSLNYEFMV